MKSQRLTDGNIDGWLAIEDIPALARIALLDLKDARDQLKTHQEMRNLYNKEPE